MATTYKEVLEKPIWFLYITLLLASTFFFLLSYQSSRVPSHITSGVPLVLTIMAWLAWNRHPFCFIWWLLPCCAVRSPRSLQLVRETKLCTYCESILLASPLLNGTDSFLNLTSSTEWHDFRVQHRRAGADGVHGLACPLCTLLLDDTIMGLTKVKSSSSYGTFEIKKGTSRPILELKIWQPIRQEGRTFLQLYLSDQPISARFEIHEGKSLSSEDMRCQ
jgi:hypothetical protein